MVGQIVSGSDFFDRGEELDRLFEDGMRDHILLLAPRRVGKTSLLHRFAERVETGDRGHAIYASAQGASDELGFVRAVYEGCLDHRTASGALGARAKRGFKSVLRRVREVELAGFALRLDGTDPTGWTDRARELLAALDELDGHWFFLLDELPVFVVRLLRADPTVARARAFLEWFRSIRQKPLGREVRRHWVLAGSIGLDTVAHRAQLSDTVNDLRPMRLGPFTPEVARAFVRALGEGERVPLAEPVVEHLIARAGWPIPFHLQLLFAEIRDRHRETGRLPAPADVDLAFEALLARHAHFDTWHERLKTELGGPYDQLAYRLLRACAVDPRGASRQTLAAVLAELVKSPADVERALRFLLDVLESDGYLFGHEGRWAFRSSLLREFWRRRYA